MNDLSPAERAELIEQARELAEVTPWGVERCAVMIQTMGPDGMAQARRLVDGGSPWPDAVALVLLARQAAEAYGQLRRAADLIAEAFAQVVQAFQPVVAEIEKLGQALANNEAKAPRPAPVCPSHGERLRGGLCRRCARHQTRRMR